MLAEQLKCGLPLVAVIKAYKEAGVAFRRAHRAALDKVRSVTDDLPGFHYFDPTQLL